MISDQQLFNAKILIVDDQKLHVLLLEKILESAGYKNIVSETSPRKTVDVFNRFQPDVVLMDLHMPEVDGLMLIKQLKELKAGTYLPILALSVDKSQDTRMRALEAGATDFLSKPYENIEVVVRIRSMIEIRLLDDQVRNQNKILETKVHERTKELSETRLDIIHRLARAAEFRDNETGVHVIRMSRYCEKLGKAAGLSDSQCELLLTASPLHDIGKIGIPDSVLLKPGKLTPEEWEIMKTHTTIGAELLSGSGFALMKMAELIALTHHEKWDGSGYPKGLKGEDIPLVGRICGVCDVFDALTSKRPYKEPWTVEATVEEIKKQSGRHFDPHLVESFLKILPEISAVRQQFVEE